MYFHGYVCVNKDTVHFYSILNHCLCMGKGHIVTSFSHNLVFLLSIRCNNEAIEMQNSFQSRVASMEIGHLKAPSLAELVFMKTLCIFIVYTITAY